MKNKTITGTDPADLDGKVNEWMISMGDSIKVLSSSTTSSGEMLVCTVTYEPKTTLLFD